MDDASSKNFLISQFSNYKIVKEHSILNKLHEIQLMLTHFK